MGKNNYMLLDVPLASDGFWNAVGQLSNTNSTGRETIKHEVDGKVNYQTLIRREGKLSNTNSTGK
jgi:hypothetical protein